MLMTSAARIAMLCTSLLSGQPFASAAIAQEQERSVPWATMQGRNAGAVGTCPDVDGGEGDTCYIVRCQPKIGVVFVIQHAGIADDEDVRSVRIKIGRYSQEVRLENGVADERLASAKAYPDLFKALISGKRWADLDAIDAKFQYTTQFELTHAKATIGKVVRQCKP
jgi:hypothetical protein